MDDAPARTVTRPNALALLGAILLAAALVSLLPGPLGAVVSAVRSIRSTLGISPSKQVSLLFRGGNADDAARIAKFSAQLTFLLNLDRVDTIAGDPPAAAPAVVGDLQLFVPLEGLVDLDAERGRLDKEIAKVAAEKDKSEAKLAKFGGNVESGQARHLDVGEQHIGTCTKREGNSVRTGPCLPDHLDVGLDVQESRERAEDHRLVLGNHDPDHDATGDDGHLPGRVGGGLAGG